MIDYRSDTLTRPTPGMLEAMLNAPVGDDVYGEDPTVNQLEQKVASLFGMDAALFCPSGTMTNQIAIKCHTHPGDEVICDVLSHVYIYEGGGIALNSGSQVRALQSKRGILTAEMVKNAINPDDVHKARTSLVVAENTTNRGGGACYSFSNLTEIKTICKEHNLAFHLDGARVFNAIIANQESPEMYGQTFDSISVCLSKGLGAPVGSVLLGNKEFIKQARRIRKVFGGGMRQAGILAAAGIYALDNHVERLAEDHQHAQILANALAKKDFTKDLMSVTTNIIIFEVGGTFTPNELASKLKEHGIITTVISPTQIRMVLHLDISPTMVEQTLDVISKI